MKKISTLFKKEPTNLSRVINEINPENNWVFTDSGVKATRKYDGTACAIIDGQLYKRYDVKNGKKVPEFAIPCQEPDSITGHWPHWILCQHDNPADKYHFEGLHNLHEKKDGTYELCGPKVQCNPEQYGEHHLIKHGISEIDLIASSILPNAYSFDSLREYLSETDIEGIVFHHLDGRMCKIRKSDFGFKR